MDGFWRCPRFEVVWRGSWPMACMRGSVKRNASITTLPAWGGRGGEEVSIYIVYITSCSTSHYQCTYMYTWQYSSAIEVM